MLYALLPEGKNFKEYLGAFWPWYCFPGYSAGPVDLNAPSLNPLWTSLTPGSVPAWFSKVNIRFARSNHDFHTHSLLRLVSIISSTRLNSTSITRSRNRIESLQERISVPTTVQRQLDKNDA